MASASEVILGVSGSIAAYKSCDLLRRLQDIGCQVSVMMTKEAENFVTPLTLSALSGRKVFRDMFSVDNPDWEMAHVSLTQKAKVFVIAPATANIIGKIAHGIADDLLTCAVMAAQCPVVLAPAMNTHMYNNRIVRENINKLEKNGMKFVLPVKGLLACGVVGDGHLADVDDIVKAVQRSLKK